MSDSIHAEIVRGWPPDDLALFPGERFHHLEETGSTNDDLLARARAGAALPFDLICADHQSHGRGRRGDRWEAPPGRNLLFSLALPLAGDRRLWPRIPHLTASIVGSTVESILGPAERLQAKWPNDLLHGGLKLAGILVEIVLTPRPFAVVGIGLNVNLRHEELPAELKPIATSVYELLGCESSRWFLLGQIVLGFLRNYPRGIEHFDETLAWIRQRDHLAGKSLALKSGQDWHEGVARGIGDDGALLLEGRDGTFVRIVSAEEIRVG